MKSRLVLVTGGAGYAGSVLVPLLLAEGYRVRVLDSFLVGDRRSLLHVWGDPAFEFVAGDVRDSSTRSRGLASAWAVVHLAAVVGDPACARDPQVSMAVNLQATRRLVSEASAHGVERFVFASTCSNYGKMGAPDAYATEEWPLNPVSLYAETKVAAERDVLSHATSGFAPTCLRFATLYGTSPRMRFDLTVNGFVRDALLLEELVVYGEEFWRPYVHVRDAGRAIAAALGADEQIVSGEVFNVGSSRENFRKGDLVRLLLERLPDTTVSRVAQVDDPRDYRVAFDKVAERLGFSVSRTVPDGMDEVLDLLRAGQIADPFATVYRN